MQRGTEELTFIREWVKETKASSAASGRRPVQKSLLEPIAITGVSGFFPGCEDAAAFWRHLDRDESLITEIPRDRFDWAAYPELASGREGARQAGWGGFIPDIASFDPGAFKILPLEAEEMDPRQRLLLMSTWRTLEDASIDPRSLTKSNTGVFVACEGNEYGVLMSRAGFRPKMGFGQANSMVANRISYQFDFAGPSEMVDATCAGFAVALHRAVVALRAGLIDRAIVGAANLILLPDPFIFLAEAGQLSARNTVKSFGRDGDGFVRAEGVGTILIERRQDANSGGRPIYAEIKHTAVNFNGQGGLSMASPNTEAHAQLIKACYREAGIDPRDLSYIEAQGMGSPVADIAEWTAINRALTELCEEKGLRTEPGFCRISTLKPMLGHMHSASSLGALLKVIRSFQTRKIHKILDYTEPNEYCDMRGTPCRIATETESWESAGKPRLAAIHAYGSGGNNAHLLLEEAQENRRAETDARPRLPGYPFKTQRYWFQSEAASPPESTGQDADVLHFIRKILGSDSNSFDPHAPFTDLGLDSLSIAPFVSRLEAEFGVSLRKSDLFSHATPARLASYLRSLTGAGQSPTRAIHRPRPKEAKHDDIAIIGMSLQVAGAESPAAFWRLLREGRSAIAAVPPERLGGSDARWKTTKGGFLSDVDTFDPLFFRISPKESASMDPRHRKLLQAAWAAIEDSGHSPDEWKGAEHGIFIGIEESDYPYNEQSAITAVHGGTAPARIGYFLDIKGPVLAISTACSSSLVAVHYACRSILDGESDCALAGGCNIISQPARSFYALSQMGDMLSPDGTCYAFDRRANGMVIGEAVGLVLLKRLSQALRDRDPIYAVIKGSGINYDGKTNGLTAPSGTRQRELYESVYRQSRIEPARISYVVAHGTGTSLGDPVECNALIDAFRASPAKKPWCALTSPKTNIGHTQAASGIVNLITASLALNHGEIPPSLNYENANDDLNLEASPFYVNTALKAWNAAERYAAVSSFGHTGTNAHVLLANAAAGEEEAGEPALGQPVVIVLSAKSKERLREAAKNLLECPISNLADLAYTLQVGRAPMDERLGLVAKTIEELRGKLNGFLKGAADLEGVYRGEVKRDDAMVSLFAADADLRKSIEDWMGKGKPAEVLQLWVNGVDLDWNRFYGANKPRRIHLPTYPFEKERYWLKTGSPPATPNDAAERSEEIPDRLTLPDADEAMEVMTFKEEWVASALVPSSANTMQTLVCILADSAKEQAWRDEMRRVAPQAEWIFVSKDAAGECEEGFREIRKTHGSVDALVYLQPFEVPEAIRDPSGLLPLLRALDSTELTPGRLLLVGPFRNDLERCYMDAWVAFERSLKPVFPRTRAAVLGLCIEGTNEAAARKLCAEALWAELHSAEGQSVLYENGQRRVLGIEPTTLSSAEPPLKRGGTYLITGGCGALGFLSAEHLAKRYSANLILTGRSALDQKARARLDSLKRLGGDAVYVQADVCDPDGMKAALAEAKKRLGPVNGVIHAAGVEGSRSVLEKEPDAFQEVMYPKVQGTLALEDVLRDEPLDFIAYFSSSAAVLGDFGSCDYAIANRFQTAYARYRNGLRELGERTGQAIVVNWPVWKQGSMGGAEEEQTRFYLKTSGQRALETEEGLALFEQLLGQKTTQHLVLVGKPGRVHRFLGLHGSPAAAPVERKGGRGRKPDMKGFSLEECIQWDLKELIGALLNIERPKLKLEINLADFGFDSISLAEFAERLSAHYELKITPALFFGHSTIQRLIQYFLDEHRGVMEQFYAQEAGTEQPVRDLTASPRKQPAGSAGAGSRLEEARLGRDEPIAVIGMSGRFPQARNIEEMWKILSEGRDAVEEVPAERFDWREFYGDPARDKKKSNGKWMGCLPGVAEFDPLFFEISPREAETMDPRQRHLLQESWKALEDAGYGPRQIANHKVGVYVGVEEGDYVFLAGEGELTANHSAILASRLAYLLDFRGPVMAINTACSSGLVAAHQACSSLRNLECDAALVAGVSLQLTPAGHIAMGQSGMLSSDGKCFVFDKRANGLVPGEAAVALVLKRLSQAEADGDPIHAVIRASGVNYDGKTNGITAPSGVAQTELLKSVYETARLDPGAIEYIVTHGTGTKLGDPVEVNALQNAFKDATSKRGYCALTSTKSNFGHTFAASGLVSAVSLVEAFRHEEIPASLHCEEENDYIIWEDSAFYVNKRNKAWPKCPGKKRLGAVSAFGMSGTNAHMVFEEYVSPGREEAATAPCYLLVLSAKTEEALREKIDALADALRRTEVQAAGLTRVSYTLLEGRHHFPYRMATVVQDVEDAILALEKAKTGETGPHFWRGRAPPEFTGQKAIRKHAEALLAQSRTLLDAPESYQETLCALGDLYCQGYVLSWPLLFGDRPPRRIGLPTYPFARETYWVERRHETSGSGASGWLHPLVHANTSSFDEQRFSSTFTGKEFFLAHHRVQGELILPGVAYLEMARAALELSVPADEQAAIALSNIVWVTPLAVSDPPREVHIGLLEEEGRIEFEVYVESENEIVTHARGKASYAESNRAEPLDLPALRGRMNHGRLDPAQCYAAFRSAGVDYGAAYQGLRDVLLGNDEVLARIALPDSVRDSADQYVLHPSLMDSAFQATVGLELSSTRTSAPRIPFALEALRSLGPLPEEAWVWARRSPGRIAGEEMARFDLDIADEAGRVLVQMRGFSTRALPAPGLGAKPLSFRRILTGDEFYLEDHGALLPGVVSLEWARAAGRLALGGAVRGLQNVVWKQPLTVDGASREVQTTLAPSGEGYTYRVIAGETIHAQGLIVGDKSPEAAAPPLPIGEIRSRCASSMPEREYEALLEARLGPSMRSITGFHYNGTEALAALELPACVKETAGEFILHPSMLNGAIQACNILAMIENREGGSPTPFSLDELWIHRAIPAEACVYVKKNAEPLQPIAGSRLSKYDLLLTDRSGEIVVAVKGYAALSAKKSAEDDTLFAVPCWSKTEAVEPSGREAGSPVFILTEQTAGLREALLEKWPGARIEALSRPSTSRADDLEANFGQVFQLIQNCLREETKLKQPVLLLASEQTDSAISAACSGLFRTARLEQPRIEAKVIRCVPALTASMDKLVGLLKSELGQSSGDIEIRFTEAGDREVRSIRETALGRAPTGSKGRAGEVIWITGGLGGLGRAFARHYALERKARVFLTGRSPLDEVKRAFLQELQAEGADILYLQGDVASSGEVESMLKSILDTAGGLNGVIHCAGVIEDAYIVDKRREAIERVWRPKVGGALALDAATRHIDLDFMALFSSLTGAFGNAGQSDYAGANAFLDNFAEERNRLVAAGQRRGRTFSVAWPLWQDGGMGMDEQSEILLKHRSGMTPMATAKGISAFHRVLQSEHGHVLVLHGDTGKIRAKLFHSREKTDLPPDLSKREANAAGLSSEQVQAELRRIVAEQQKIAPEKIELDGELPQYGFDSIRLTELANRLNQAFCLELMPTLFFEHTTLRAIARHLIEKHPGALTAKFSRGHSAGSPNLPEARPARRQRFHRRRKEQAPAARPTFQPIAIVGVSGRFPGSANLDAFWRHLEANHDLISEVPEDRWNWREHYGDPFEQPGKTKVKSAGFMTGIDQFDPAFFGISPREAISMDPQFRLMLETVWATIEDAGYRASELSGTKTGVFVGVSTSDYKDAWLRKVDPDAVQDGPALVSHFVIANRISYALNLHGPSEPIDTACSSSLIAIHRAIEAMRQGNCEQAIVGGVNVISTPDITIGASRAGMLSEDGRCKTFDQAADGYGRGEGVGALLLKPLDAAVRDGDHIYALVRGSAENHGGRAHSPTAPNPAAQRDLLVTAYTRAGVDPRTVGYIEAHGTGTALGDPIEIEGLKGAFAALYQQSGVAIDGKHCGLGSVKTNVGHLEAAAGIAGVLKVVMMLRHEKIPGNVHLHEPNPYLRLEGTPFYLVRETQDWEPLLDERQRPWPRRAGVSSFGIGGSNAHVILEEYAPDAPESVANEALPGPLIFVLSARNKDRLKELARNLRDFLEASSAGPLATLREVAYTLQVGREAMEERLGFVATSIQELTGKLSDFVEGAGELEGLYRGRVSRDGKAATAARGEAAPPIADWLKQGKQTLLLEQWMQGVDLDWRQLWRDPRPRRASLPAYPFARNRYWFEDRKNGIANRADAPGKEAKLDEILEQVRQKRLSVEEAEQLIDELGLENIAEKKETGS